MSKWSSKLVKPKTKAKRFKLGPIVILLLAALLFWWADSKMSPVVFSVAEEKTQLEITKLINEAVKAHASETNFADLIELHKDNDGKISLLLPNTAKINQVAADVALDLQARMNQLAVKGIEVPTGLASGSAILSALGPKIKVQVTPIGQVNVKVEDLLTASGINQSKYSIFLNIQAKFKISVPFQKQETIVESKALLVEGVIIGPIPETYLNWQNN